MSNTNLQRENTHLEQTFSRILNFKELGIDLLSSNYVPCYN